MRYIALLVGLMAAAGANAVAFAFPADVQIASCEQHCNSEYAGCMAGCGGAISCIDPCIRYTCGIDHGDARLLTDSMPVSHAPHPYVIFGKARIEMWEKWMEDGPG
ncbi:hypothetical protein K490DRAFT_58513 [Saccharata proteae CBS 121410]|uniref:Uncharacterized protein n=1 Tax=Saccharata proteae CBS 121410 TaxID=1314787 RepID=A0A9P4LTK1_9PEZI|nr:hypothetical protein K490DRAFT_58513 [Saccharata proteae CBS 121410]